MTFCLAMKRSFGRAFSLRRNDGSSVLPAELQRGMSAAGTHASEGQPVPLLGKLHIAGVDAQPVADAEPDGDEHDIARRR